MADFLFELVLRGDGHRTLLVERGARKLLIIPHEDGEGKGETKVAKGMMNDESQMTNE
jgi:hypothetical protein